MIAARPVFAVLSQPSPATHASSVHGSPSSHRRPPGASQAGTVVGGTDVVVEVEVVEAGSVEEVTAVVDVGGLLDEVEVEVVVGFVVDEVVEGLLVEEVVVVVGPTVVEVDDEDEVEVLEELEVVVGLMVVDVEDEELVEEDEEVELLVEVELLDEVEVELELVEDRKSTRLNSSHIQKSRMPSSA